MSTRCPARTTPRSRPTCWPRWAATPRWSQQALDHLARLAGKPLAELDAAKRDAIANEFRANGGDAAATLVRVVLQCYYRDDRVLRSLGLELRAPFPKGYALEQGDWSLLDPVKARSGTLRRAQ